MCISYPFEESVFKKDLLGLDKLFSQGSEFFFHILVFINFSLFFAACIISLLIRHLVLENDAKLLKRRRPDVCLFVLTFVSE